jgi:hypothetical protein
MHVAPLFNLPAMWTALGASMCLARKKAVTIALFHRHGLYDKTICKQQLATLQLAAVAFGIWSGHWSGCSAHMLQLSASSSAALLGCK